MVLKGVYGGHEQHAAFFLGVPGERHEPGGGSVEEGGRDRGAERDKRESYATLGGWSWDGKGRDGDRAGRDKRQNRGQRQKGVKRERGEAPRVPERSEWTAARWAGALRMRADGNGDGRDGRRDNRAVVRELGCGLDGAKTQEAQDETFKEDSARTELLASMGYSTEAEDSYQTDAKRLKDVFHKLLPWDGIIPAFRISTAIDVQIDTVKFVYAFLE
ncbi:hypothetical protein AJ79_02149 [Helicocarpus griseus UAMH5409]|uniref:Uncharacterized protein n=1 Tax=Helicocarpus griseus UAMH5409 TaxID=1447875 RepID=A0A2B7Y3P5_9EURO|nr:hypothetical protein AJ79_02149 [Helicocarpus griseus UAMH5409]